MGIPIKLQAFEGPLDLLLHLIDKNKVNIYDIPIVEITNQYLEYIQQMQQKDLNIMSEFLVMAATLIDIKSKMLLPVEVNDEGKEMDPRQELVEQLLQYKMYKYISYELRDKLNDVAPVWYKKTDIPKEVKEYQEPVDIEKLLHGVTLPALNRLFQDILKRQKDRIDPVRSTFGEIEKEDVNLEDKMDVVEQYIWDRRSCTFRELLFQGRTKMQMVVTFLAVLELMKSGKIHIRQENTFSEIFIFIGEYKEVTGEEHSGNKATGRGN